MNTAKIVDKFERSCLRHRLLKSNARILIGVSGGADSIALALLFKELQAKYSLVLMAAHVNYHLRGEESDADEQFVKEFCFSQNIPLYILPAKLEKKDDLQKKARDIRLEYFQKIKKYYKLEYIALGHHQDDQVETVLHKIIRGAGFGGLSGIQVISGDIIHPLLALDKKTIIKYLDLKKMGYRIDSTNTKNDYTRNKLRNELIPHILNDYNVNFEKRLVEYGNLFGLADEYFKKQAIKEYKNNIVDIRYNSQEVKKKKDEKAIELIFEIPGLKKCSPIIMFYILRLAFEKITGSEKDFYTNHFNEIQSIIEIESGYKEIDLPNSVVAIKDYQRLLIRNKAYTLKEQAVANTETTKELPTVRKTFSFNDKRFTMQQLRHLPEDITNFAYERVIMDFDKIIFPITMRYRRDGDKFIPLGMNKPKKIKDFFMDLKISMLERDNIAIFCDAEKIIWISGLRIDQRVAITPETKNYLIIKLEDVTSKRKLGVKQD